MRRGRYKADEQADRCAVVHISYLSQHADYLLFNAGKLSRDSTSFYPKLSPERRNAFLQSLIKACQHLRDNANNTGVAESVYATGGAAGLLQLASIMPISVAHVPIEAVVALTAANQQITQSLAQGSISVSFFAPIATEVPSL